MKVKNKWSFLVVLIVACLIAVPTLFVLLQANTDSDSSDVFIKKFVGINGDVANLNSDPIVAGDIYYIEGTADITERTLFKFKSNGEFMGYLDTAICNYHKAGTNGKDLYVVCDRNKEIPDGVYLFNEKSDSLDLVFELEQSIYESNDDTYEFEISNGSILIVDDSGLHRFDLESKNLTTLAEDNNLFNPYSGTNAIRETSDKIWLFDYMRYSYFDKSNSEFTNVEEPPYTFFSENPEFELTYFSNDNLVVEDGDLVLYWEVYTDDFLLSSTIYRTVYNDKENTWSTEHIDVTSDDLRASYGRSYGYLFDIPTPKLHLSSKDYAQQVKVNDKITNLDVPMISLDNSENGLFGQVKYTDLSGDCTLYAYFLTTVDTNPPKGTIIQYGENGYAPAKVGSCDEKDSTDQKLENAINGLLTYEVSPTEPYYSYGRGFTEMPQFTVSEDDGFYTIDFNELKYRSIGDFDISEFKSQLHHTMLLYLDIDQFELTLNGSLEYFDQWGCNCGG